MNSTVYIFKLYILIVHDLKIRTEGLAAKGELIMCLNEMPNIIIMSILCQRIFY